MKQAIVTDIILSAEIIAVALAAVADQPLATKAGSAAASSCTACRGAEEALHRRLEDAVTAPALRSVFNLVASVVVGVAVGGAALLLVEPGKRLIGLFRRPV